MTQWAPITLEEMEALHGLPHLQRCLYMQLVFVADRRTGRVGIKSGLSLLGLQQRLEVHPARGRHADHVGQPTKKAIRSALNGLENAGLIKPCGNGEVLAFLLPLAYRVSSRVRDEGHMKDADEGAFYPQEKTPESLAAEGFSQDAADDGRHIETPDEGHISKSRVNHLSKQSSSSYQLPVDNFRPDVMMMAMSKNDLAGLVVWLERKRGKAVVVASTDPVVAKWHGLSVTGLELSEAHRIAVMYRKTAGSEAAVNPGYLDSILRSQVLNRREVSRKGGASGPPVWFVSTQGIEAMAEKHGLARADGETDDALKGRVMFAVAQAEDAARRARREKRKASAG